MQFYLNGFYPGDPAVVPTPGRTARARLEDQGEVDVLIVGTGPAGLVLAAQLAQHGGITTRVVERRAGPLEFGQADGVACRTVEMLDTFGCSARVMAEAYWVNELSFWRPDPADDTRIVRSGRDWDTDDGLSEFPHLILNQARLLELLLEVMRNSAQRLSPDYGVACVGLEASPSATHPVRVTLARGKEDFTVDARYVVGCDGARSVVRQAMGLELKGDVANHAWGVVDVLAVTDFPDIRLKATIQSTSGSIVLIPREGGYMARFYVDLGEVTSANRARVRAMTSQDVMAIAARVIAPYRIDVHDVAWFSIYEVAQRLTDTFDDARDRDGLPRVFIAGDACHTHSAKAGQGMNVSMQDAFNLGWKLAAVLNGRSDPALLATYSAERQPIARELIEFDREWSAMLAAPPRDPARPERGGLDPDELQNYFVRQGRYTAGVATRYPPSTLIGPPDHSGFAAGFEIGTRFHSAPVIRAADGRSMQLGHVARADGRWRLYAFADRTGERLAGLCAWLEDGADSPLQRFTPPDGDIDAVIDPRAILQTPHREVVLSRLPPLLLPSKGTLGLADYEKVFCPDPRPGRDIFDGRRIDRDHGCLVVVRPDQFVAHILPLDAHEELAAFFERILLAPAVART
ncbi:MAG TPA: FAD-dependent monooxygenase [Solirubrobacteraceae bacterium]|nr:FAD-dependent monooxygenase [Solirubrobacteraceae bacterium]